MVNPITPSEFHGRSDLPDWRVVLGRIEASFRAATFDAAAKLITAIASAAEAAGHHPDLDLRYPADVYVRLTTHAAGGLTDADATLQRRSRLSRRRSVPPASRVSRWASKWPSTRSTSMRFGRSGRQSSATKMCRTNLARSSSSPIHDVSGPTSGSNRWTRRVHNAIESTSTWQYHTTSPSNAWRTRLPRVAT